MKTPVALALLMMVLSHSAGQAQPAAPSREDQAACRSDAVKFCASHIGKPPEMGACLDGNKTKLSDACRKVVEARGG